MITDEHYKRLARWVLSEVRYCGELSRRCGIEHKMNGMLCGVAHATNTIDSKSYAMKLVEDLWATFGGYMYMRTVPPKKEPPKGDE